MKVNFYIADEIRQEASGKQMLLGFYADYVLIVNIPKNAPDNTHAVQLEKLTLLLNISDFGNNSDNLSSSLQLFGPDNKALGDVQQLPATKAVSTNQSINYVVEIKPFVINSEGGYKLTMTVTDTKTSHAEKFDFEFFIRYNFI
ncbi:MAG TPA: hypothetical protein VGJ90_06955 [Methylophilaceae bacterium]